jgi:hypothetical protein
MLTSIIIINIIVIIIVIVRIFTITIISHQHHGQRPTLKIAMMSSMLPEKQHLSNSS